MNKNTKKEDVSIRQYAFRAREKTYLEFDENNKAQLETTLAELQKILNIKLLVISVGCDFDINNQARYDAFALTKNALDILVSALHMARQRAVLETMSLLRVALECGSTALHIAKDSDAYVRYKKCDYNSTKAISFAKQFIPILGEVWGAFSNTAVHANMIGFGPKIKSDEKGTISRVVKLEYGSRKLHPIQDKVVLTSISLVSAMVLKITELILFEKSQLHEKALRLAGTKTIYISNTDAKIIEYDELLRSYPSQVR
jgi:hypothetical protein